MDGMGFDPAIFTLKTPKIKQIFRSFYQSVLHFAVLSITFAGYSKNN
jgi:hypothetical protein